MYFGFIAFGRESKSEQTNEPTAETQQSRIQERLSRLAFISSRTSRVRVVTFAARGISGA